MGFQESSSSEGKKSSTYPTRQVTKKWHKCFLQLSSQYLRQQTTTLLPNQARSGRAGTGKQVQGSSCLCDWCCSWFLYCACYRFPLLVPILGIIFGLLLVAIADNYLVTLGSIVGISGSVSSEGNWRDYLYFRLIVYVFIMFCNCTFHAFIQSIAALQDITVISCHICSWLQTIRNRN